MSAANGIELSVCDNGIGLQGNGDPGGLGSHIVVLLTQQLNGSLVYERQNAGLCAHLRAPATSH
jgi:two-component sensor histidine kinase